MRCFHRSVEDRRPSHGSAPCLVGEVGGGDRVRRRAAGTARVERRADVGRCGRRRKAEELGDGGFRGAQQRGVAEARPRWRAVRTTLEQLGVGTVAGAVAAAHLADDHGGPDGLFGAPVERRVPQEEEHGRAWPGAPRSARRRRAAAVRRRRRRALSRPRAVMPCSLSSPALQRCHAGPAPRRPRDCRDDPPGGAWPFPFGAVRRSSDCSRSPSTVAASSNQT